MENNATNTY